MKQTQNLLVAAAASVVLAASVSGAVYMKYDGVDGESKDAGHEKWSEIISISHTISRPMVTDPTTGQRRRGAVDFGEVVCTKALDKASPKIAEALLGGRVFPKVEIHLTATYTDAGRVTYYRYELKNVQVTSYSISGATDGGERPVEQMALNYEEIKVTYTEVDSEGVALGNVEYEWKVEEGES